MTITSRPESANLGAGIDEKKKEFSSLL